MCVYMPLIDVVFCDTSGARIRSNHLSRLQRYHLVPFLFMPKVPPRLTSATPARCAFVPIGPTAGEWQTAKLRD